jgi:hypothetical protein
MLTVSSHELNKNNFIFLSYDVEFTLTKEQKILKNKNNEINKINYFT